ncbi:peptidylprolyl isomerase [Peptacetobacter sp.]|uniref:peptidylprolyl isomerase n=1 Tax=Peptacetobacter sp. TaxID=2991975 RepID=UPI002E7654B6|nr:peptidylprolyl isomerase [Peptacetobacter sp.]MEE0451130.1 peptidylprolyl isomerase [Peptacetobacter sp.]
MKKLMTIVLAGLMSLSLVACKQKDLNEAVADVNGTKITLGQYEFMLKMNKASVESTIGGAEGWEQKDQSGQTYKDKYKTLVLDQMINTELLAQNAEKEGIKVTDKEIQSSYNDLKTYVNSDEQIKKSAEDLGISDDFLKEQAKLSLLIQKSQEKFYSEEKVSDSEMKKYYDEHIDEYKKDEVEASHILIKTTDDQNKPLPEAEQKKAKEKAEKVLKEVKAGGDFAELAKKYSQDPGSAANGGALGAFGKGMMVKEFEDAAFGMEPGQVSDLVKTDFGYHIIKVTDRIKETTSFDEAKEGIKEEILKNKYGEKIAELQKKAKIEKFDKVIESAEFVEK